MQVYFDNKLGIIRRLDVLCRVKVMAQHVRIDIFYRMIPLSDGHLQVNAHWPENPLKAMQPQNDISNNTTLSQLYRSNCEMRPCISRSWQKMRVDAAISRKEKANGGAEKFCSYFISSFLVPCTEPQNENRLPCPSYQSRDYKRRHACLKLLKK